jgi:hypothetical protein
MKAGTSGRAHSVLLAATSRCGIVYLLEVLLPRLRSSQRALAFAIVAAFPLAACSSSSNTTERFVSASAKTPEDAIKGFVGAVAKADGEKVLRWFAISNYAKGFDFVANANRIGALTPAQDLPPSSTPMFRSFNEVGRASASAGEVTMLVYSMISSLAETPEALTRTEPITGSSNLVEEFVASLDPANLTPFTVKEIARVAAPGTVQGDKMKSVWAARSKIAGADEWREYLALYEIGPKTFIGGVTLLRYGKDWSIYSLTSALGGTSGDGSAKFASSAEFKTAVDAANEKP